VKEDSPFKNEIKYNYPINFLQNEILKITFDLYSSDLLCFSVAVPNGKGTSNHPHGPSKVWSGIAKFFFYKFCYLNRVEYEKCSEMCVWIVRFAQKLRKWDHF
jgi:hypothetical protein